MFNHSFTAERGIENVSSASSVVAVRARVGNFITRKWCRAQRSGVTLVRPFAAEGRLGLPLKRQIHNENKNISDPDAG
jgi:hypothetical protein